MAKPRIVRKPRRAPARPKKPPSHEAILRALRNIGRLVEQMRDDLYWKT